eukprot:GHVU01038200.1.p2 GENE.GHVU01038200.1~~GHVU01038200.1.p2  ORF type:complete len:110 (+),score=10.94 GHVU01038200.1:119-448(+)
MISSADGSLRDPSVDATCAHVHVYSRRGAAASASSVRAALVVAASALVVSPAIAVDGRSLIPPQLEGVRQCVSGQADVQAGRQARLQASVPAESLHVERTTSTTTTSDD